MKAKLTHVCQVFRIPGILESYEELKVGNVNRTYKVNFISEIENDVIRRKSYIVQAINTYVFKNPTQVMDNIDKVTEYIHLKTPDKITLHFHHTADRKTYVFDENGFWRLFNYIPSETYNVTTDLEVIRNAGEAFGEFQMLLSDFDASGLFVTIPDFHHTRKRFEKLHADVADDPLGKVQEVREELDWLISVREMACKLTDMHERGELPLRVTHNDTKINNVLFDKDTKKALVVIDLDTVMPGLLGNDFGDAIRFAANYVEEDCPQYDKAGINMEVFAAFAEGFLKKTAGILTDNEIHTLAASCFALTVELAVRFLDDYILGSPYFRIEYPEHNLVRARCQIALAKNMLLHMGEMEDVIAKCVERYR